MSKTRFYRLAMLVTELQQSETAEYKNSVMCLINCLILGSEDVLSRHVMRSELITLGFLAIIEPYRPVADPELMTQINVFDNHRMVDDDQLDLTEEKPIHDLLMIFLQKVLSV